MEDRDPTDETTTTEIPGGASGGGDENPQDYQLPGGPGGPDAPAEPAKRKSLWDEIWKKRGAKPKDPYAYQKLPQDDKDIPMSEFPKEKSGLPPPKGTAETSFMSGKRPEAPTQENILSEEDKEKVLEKAEEDLKIIWPNTKTKNLGGKKGPTTGVPVILGKKNG